MTEQDEPGGRVVLITGGSRGIGMACAKMFRARGDRVAITYKTTQPEDGPDAILALPCDVTVPGDVDRAFAAVEDRLGRVEVLVANAGITRDRLVLRMSEEDWGTVVDTNLSGAWRVARRAATGMVRAHSGRIVFVSSVSAMSGAPGQANYSAAKAGLIGLARSLARELASRQVTVNVVAPGLVATDMLAGVAPSRLEALTATIPLARIADPAEVAAAVGFLASGEAGYVTGAVLAVDGGLGMGM